MRQVKTVDSELEKPITSRWIKTHQARPTDSNLHASSRSTIQIMEVIMVSFKIAGDSKQLSQHLRHSLASANLFPLQVPVQQYVQPSSTTHNLLTQTQLSAQGYAPVSDFYSGAWANVRLLFIYEIIKADQTNRSTKVSTAPTKTSSQPTGSR